MHYNFAQISANGNVELSCRIRLNRFVQVDQSSPQSTWPSFTLEEKDYWFLLECSPNCLYLKGALRFLTENLAKKTSVTHCKWDLDKGNILTVFIFISFRLTYLCFRYCKSVTTTSLMSPGWVTRNSHHMIPHKYSGSPRVNTDLYVSVLWLLFFLKGTRR